MDYLIKNATLVNEGQTFRADVLVSRGRIGRIERSGGLNAESAATVVIDAAFKYLIPGIIDEHVHFREPGLTAKADIGSESRAAVAGGVTSFMDMPNTVPPTTTQELLQRKFELAAGKSLANYSFYIGATAGNLGEVLKTDFSRVCGIKLFLGSSTGDMLLDDSAALEALFSEAPALIAAHCEDEGIIRRNTAIFKEMAARGEVAADASLHPLIRSAEACIESTRRAVELAGRTGARLHVLHVSTAGELSLFRSGLPLEDKKITAETCPHYLRLSSADCARLGFGMKCNPAIKSEADRLALLEALGTGIIDTIGTDHAPHLPAEKFTGDCFTARSGFPSVQHGLQLMTGLGLPIEEIVRLMCHNPAVLYRIRERGFIREGYHADLVLVDPSRPARISAEGEFTKCGWTPFEGMTVPSTVTHTFVNGNLVFENGVFHEGSRGEMLRFS